MTVAARMRALLALLVPALVAAAPTPPPAPPAAIAANIRDGRFDPGDYRWLRGGFDGADAAEVAAYQAMLDWRKRCRISDMAETRAELTGLGVNAGAALDSIPYRSLVCDQVATLPEPLDLHDWAGFARDVAVVRPLAQGFLTAVAMGEQVALVEHPDLRDALNMKATGEQTLRQGLSWADDPSTPGGPPLDLTPQQRGILVSEIAIATATRDHANTAWLKGIVAEQGWPKRSQVGESAAKTAWLLVQHADADPAFQVRALRLMEPLVASGEADRKNYAYLYDRVMLKVTGKQRYATQLTCRGGRLVPLPLEDERLTGARRRAVGLGPLAEYAARAAKDGPCHDPAAG